MDIVERLRQDIKEIHRKLDKARCPHCHKQIFNNPEGAAESTANTKEAP